MSPTLTGNTLKTHTEIDMKLKLSSFKTPQRFELNTALRVQGVEAILYEWCL